MKTETTITQDGYEVRVMSCDSHMGDFVAYARGNDWSACRSSEMAHSGTSAGAMRASLHLARINWTYNHTCPVCGEYAPERYVAEVHPSWECATCSKNEESKND